MKKRVISAIVALIIVIPLIILGGYPYYIGQYIPYCNGGVIFESYNGGQNGKMVSASQNDSCSRSYAESWCSIYGNGWVLPSRTTLMNIYNSKTQINSTLSAHKLEELNATYYWSKDYDLNRFYPNQSNSYIQYTWYFVNMDSGDNCYVRTEGKGSGYVYPTSSYSVRAVLAF